MSFPSFSAGEVLTAADMNSVSGWLVKSQTIGTNATSITVTDAFSANYDNYKIIITGGVAAGNTLLELQLGSATTGYYWSVAGWSWSGNVADSNRGSNATRFSQVGYGTADNLFADFDICSPFLTKNTRISGHYMAPIASGGGGALVGFLDNTTSFTAFTLISVQGLTGGTIRVYGYRN
jgi:hypothetical protein